MSKPSGTPYDEVQRSSTDLAGLRQRAELCAKYDFDTVEMIECKWALWDELLEALNGPVGTMAAVDDPRSAPAGYNKGSERGHRTGDAAQGQSGCGFMAQEILDFLNSIEGAGYGGMAAFEIVRGYARELLPGSEVTSTPRATGEG